MKISAKISVIQCVRIRYARVKRKSTDVTGELYEKKLRCEVFCTCWTCKAIQVVVLDTDYMIKLDLDEIFWCV